MRNPDEFYHKMVNARNVGGEHQIILKGDQEKARLLREKQDLALVALRRTIEEKKAEKLKQNLHLIDFPKENTHIHFVSSYDDIRREARQTGQDEGHETPAAKPNSKLEQEILRAQSQNKQQYKRLADSLQKASQFRKVEQALLLDKQLKGKGKKRKVEGEDGKVSFRWFAERKK